MDAQLAPGAKVGRYEVLEHLASGGMAEVYVCRRTGIGGFERQFILKTVRAGLADDDRYLRMFLDEARIAGSVNHTNIAAVFEADEEDGLAYLVMEYVQGPSMKALVRAAESAGRVELLPMVWLVAGAARGLHHVHRASGATSASGLVHRDVSLDNILASHEGVAKVIDFGIAYAENRLSQTEGDLFKGKMSYIAPEQLRRAEIDHRADVFALGVCLYRVVVGRMPFASDTPQVQLRARLLHEYVPPRSVNAEVPEELDRIVSRAMAFEVEDRYPTAGALADDLESWVRSVAPNFRASDVAQYITACFPAPADWKPPPPSAKSTRRPTDRASAPGNTSSSGAGSLDVSVKSGSSASGPRSARRATTQAPRAPRWRTWAAISLGAVAVGLGILALVLPTLSHKTGAVAQTPAPSAAISAPRVAEVGPAPDQLPSIGPIDGPEVAVSEVASPAVASRTAVSTVPARSKAAAAAPLVVTEVDDAPVAVGPAEVAEGLPGDAAALDAVIRSLEQDGWAVVARNWRGGGYALDLVASKGAVKRFVDVRVVASGTPDASVPQGRRKLRLAADTYRGESAAGPVEYRVAAVSPGNPLNVRWIEVSP